MPDDISVVGYDDSAFMSCTEPPLTTVRQPIEPMGRAAVDLLVSQIDGERDAPSDELLFEPELVVRGSTGPACTPPRPAARAARIATVPRRPLLFCQLLAVTLRRDFLQSIASRVCCQLCASSGD